MKDNNCLTFTVSQLQTTCKSKNNIGTKKEYHRNTTFQLTKRKNGSYPDRLLCTKFSRNEVSKIFRKLNPYFMSNTSTKKASYLSTIAIFVSIT